METRQSHFFGSKGIRQLVTLWRVTPLAGDHGSNGAVWYRSFPPLRRRCADGRQHQVFRNYPSELSSISPNQTLAEPDRMTRVLTKPARSYVS